MNPIEFMKHYSAWLEQAKLELINKGYEDKFLNNKPLIKYSIKDDGRIYRHYFHGNGQLNEFQSSFITDKVTPWDDFKCSIS